MSYIDVDDYQPTPRSADPADTIADLRLAIRWLIGELEKADAVIREREQNINQLHSELSVR